MHLTPEDGQYGLNMQHVLTRPIKFVEDGGNASMMYHNRMNFTKTVQNWSRQLATHLPHKYKTYKKNYAWRQALLHVTG